MLPSHKQLLLPVMESLQKRGGSAEAKDVVNDVAERLQLSTAVREAKGIVSGRTVNLFARRVRWVRQDAIRRDFLSAEAYGRWQLTDSGNTYLQNIRPGFIITIYETDLGRALWAEAEAAAGVIDDESINLILTSPEYPLLRKKQYGNRQGQHYLDWLCNLASEWKRMLVDDGSLVLNVGPVWERGQPTQSVYEERLLLRLIDEVGFYLAQRCYYHSPSRIPSSEWVTIRRVRVRNTVENIWWLSKTPNPKADNRRILTPYSDRMRKLIASGGETRRERPAGHGGTKNGFSRDNGGMIPSNLINTTNAASNDHYHRMCRQYGLPAHPAAFGDSIPSYFIRLLTEPGDVVYDPCSGSGKTAAEAERLGRRWITNDRSLTYVSGSKFRLPSYRNVAPDLCAI